MERMRSTVAGLRDNARHLQQLLVAATREFFHDRSTFHAAAMSYYVLFSLFPLALLVVGVASIFLDEDAVRDQVVTLIADNVALTGEGREDLENQLGRAIGGVGALGFIGLVGLLWSATSMMTALRNGINIAWNVRMRRHFARGKLLDLGLVTLLGVLFVASIALTVVVRLVRDGVADSHVAAGSLVGVAMALLPVLISFSAFTLVYRVVPAVRTRFADVWLGAAIAAVLFELAKAGLTFYFANFTDYNAVYGGLGAVITFLFFVWVVSCIILYGAQLASEWPRVRAGFYDRDGDEGEARSIGDVLRDQARQLVARKPDDERATTPQGGRRHD